MRQRRVPARNGLSTGLITTITYVRRTASGAAGNALGTTINHLRRTRNGAAGNGLDTKIKCKWQTTAASSAECSSPAATAPRRSRKRCKHRPELHDQVRAMHSERHRGQEFRRGAQADAQYFAVVPRPMPAAPHRYLIVAARRLPAAVVCHRHLYFVSLFEGIQQRQINYLLQLFHIY
jgi:hypothetical protein